MAQLVFEYDSARLADPPRTVLALQIWAVANPGRFTYPQPPDYLGLTFLKQLLYGLIPEPAILQGVSAWLVSMALVVFLGALAGGSGLLAGSDLGQLTPPGAPAAAVAGAAAAVVDPNVAIAIRNAALASVLGMLIGLMGSVVGGWMGSGERMHPYHYRTRDAHRAPRTDVRSSL